jgi:hypothetical protein
MRKEKIASENVSLAYSCDLMKRSSINEQHLKQKLEMSTAWRRKDWRYSSSSLHTLYSPGLHLKAGALFREGHA